MTDTTISVPALEKLLTVVAGRWKTLATYEPGLFSPEGGRSDGLEESRVGPGRSSIILETRSGSATTSFEGAGFIVWDDHEKLYHLHWLTSLSPEPGFLRGRWEGERAVFEGHEYVAGQRLASRHTILDIEADSFGYTIELGPTEQQLRTVITVQYVRLFQEGS